MAVFTDKVLTDRLTELARRAFDKGIPVTTRFLSPEEAAYAAALGRKMGVAATLFGGMDGTERVMCCYHDEGDMPRFSLQCVRLSWDRRQPAPGHRDLLGSILALGIDRAYVGDILLKENEAFVFAAREMALLIADRLLSAGKTPLACRIADDLPDMQAPDELLFRDTVASLRLDNVLASGMRLSRGKAAEWIAAGRVSLNHEICQRPDAKLRQGDMISVRGFGRMRLNEIGPPTKKERFPVTLAVFGKK